MEFPTRSRARSMVSFIPMVSLASALAFATVARAGDTDCQDSVAAVELAMQDGLDDLAVGRDLRDEAQSHAGAAPGADSAACRFLTHGQQATLRAETHFRKCEEQLEAIRTRCTSPDWSALSASPQTCRATLKEIERDLISLAEERTVACGG